MILSATVGSERQRSLDLIKKALEMKITIWSINRMAFASIYFIGRAIYHPTVAQCQSAAQKIKGQFKPPPGASRIVWKNQDRKKGKDFQVADTHNIDGIDNVFDYENQALCHSKKSIREFQAV